MKFRRSYVLNKFVLFFLVMLCAIASASPKRSHKDACSNYAKTCEPEYCGDILMIDCFRPSKDSLYNGRSREQSKVNETIKPDKDITNVDSPSIIIQVDAGGKIIDPNCSLPTEVIERSVAAKAISGPITATEISRHMNDCNAFRQRIVDEQKAKERAEQKAKADKERQRQEKLIQIQRNVILHQQNVLRQRQIQETRSLRYVIECQNACSAIPCETDCFGPSHDVSCFTNCKKREECLNTCQK